MCAAMTVCTARSLGKVGGEGVAKAGGGRGGGGGGGGYLVGGINPATLKSESRRVGAGTEGVCQAVARGSPVGQKMALLCKGHS